MPQPLDLAPFSDLNTRTKAPLCTPLLHSHQPYSHAPVLESAQIPTSNSLLTFPKPHPHGILGVQSYLLRYLRRVASRPLFILLVHRPHRDFASTKLSPTPRPVHPLSLATSADRCTREGDAPDLKLLPQPLSPFYITTLTKPFLAGPSVSSAHKAGVSTGWNIGRDIRRSLATLPLHSMFKFSAFEDEGEDRDLRPTAILPTSSMPSKRLSAISRSTLSLSPKAVAKPAQRRDSSFGSDGGEEYPSTHFSESSGDEEDESHMESEET